LIESDVLQPGPTDPADIGGISLPHPDAVCDLGFS